MPIYILFLNSLIFWGRGALCLSTNDSNNIFQVLFRLALLIFSVASLDLSIMSWHCRTYRVIIDPIGFQRFFKQCLLLAP